MKKLLLAVLIALVLVFCLLAYVNFWPSEVIDIQPLKINNVRQGLPIPTPEKPVSASNEVIASSPMHHAEYPAAEDALKSIKPGIALLPLSAQKIPQDLRDRINHDLENLRKTGSMSGGVVTDQFSRVDDLSKSLLNKGFFNIQRELAINPTNLYQFLGNGFVLIGADTQAKYITDKGWTGYFQIFSNNQKNQMIELSENQFDPAAGDGVQQASDFLNSKVLNYPAVFQYIKLDNNSYIYEFQWFVDARVFMLTTKNFSQQDAQTIAESITQAYLSMPNKGWKE